MILLNEIKKINIKSIYKSLGGFGDSEANIYAVDNCFFIEYSIKSRLINESGKMQMDAESIQKLLDYLSEPKVNKNEFLNIQTINMWREKYLQNEKSLELKIINPKRLNRLVTKYWQKRWGTCQHPSIEVNLFSDTNKLLTLKSKVLKDFMLPWKVETENYFIETSNAKISFILSEILPVNFTNRELLLGEEYIKNVLKIQPTK